MWLVWLLLFAVSANGVPRRRSETHRSLQTSTSSTVPTYDTVATSATIRISTYQQIFAPELTSTPLTSTEMSLFQDLTLVESGNLTADPDLEYSVVENHTLVYSSDVTDLDNEENDWNRNNTLDDILQFDNVSGTVQYIREKNVTLFPDTKTAEESFSKYRYRTIY
jgi:hypothetical protein